MKLSKKEIKLHEQSEEILKKDNLTFDEKLFVFNNWQEGALNMNSKTGAFFTPQGLANDFSLEIYSDSDIIDLCAGIGILSFFAYHYRKCNVTCIELNPDYIRVGKKLLPEANWIEGNILDENTLLKAGSNFFQSISNPPFGKVKSTSETKTKLNYKGSEFELKTIETASKISKYGTFILPQMSTPFEYSGKQGLTRVDPSPKVKKFIKETDLEYEFNLGLDTSLYLNEWKGVSPQVEIVNFDFSESPKLKRKDQNIQYSIFNHKETA